MPSLSPIALFLALFGLLYAAFGVHSPFFPSYLESRGVGAEDLGFVLALGTALRLLAAPLAGILADEIGSRRAVLAGAILAATLAGLCFLLAREWWTVVAVSFALGLSLAPIAPLADALATAPRADQTALTNKRPHAGMRDYGLVRAGGSAAFVLGTVGAGQLVASQGLGIIVYLQAAFLIGAAIVVLRLPEMARRQRPRSEPRAAVARRDIAAVLSDAGFRRVVVVAALVFGSHAMHDAFAVIQWTRAGIPAAISSLLWSAAVAAEVFVLSFLGPRLLAALGPARAAALCALLGALRWLVMALTGSLPALMLIQPLHGFTFALLHLTCLKVLTAATPPRLLATTMSLYATLGAGIASVILTALSGLLYARFGAPAFTIMALLCLAAIPVALRLRS